MEIIEINKQRYTQAVVKVSTGTPDKFTLIPSYDADGEPIYALPGGGRATREQIVEMQMSGELWKG